MGTIRSLIEDHFHHFNAGEVRRATEAWRAHVRAGGRMMITLAGAMSTAGLGALLAPALRRGLIHGVCCTGANLEEDAFRLLAEHTFRPLPDWRHLSPEQEAALCRDGFNRVTDTAIPDDIMFELEEHLFVRWKAACESGRSDSPAAFLLDALREPSLVPRFQRPERSWLLAARDMEVPIWTPGWEDSTTGNAFAAGVLSGRIPHHGCVETGTSQMARLVRWYLETCDPAPGIGYVQVGGGIAGDFAICVVPLIRKDLGLEDTPPWGYFCQVSDAVTSYGGYSGATPNEKISWSKLTPETPRFMIQSDATIVLPLMLASLLEEEA
jgi:deoxyhypusine synthase